MGEKARERERERERQRERENEGTERERGGGKETGRDRMLIYKISHQQNNKKNTLRI